MSEDKTCGNGQAKVDFMCAEDGCDGVVQFIHTKRNVNIIPLEQAAPAPAAE